VDYFLVGEGVVEGEETAHDLGGIEGEDAEGLLRGGFVVDEEAAEVGGAGTRSHDWRASPTSFSRRRCNIDLWFRYFYNKCLFVI